MAKKLRNWIVQCDLDDSWLLHYKYRHQPFILYVHYIWQKPQRLFGPNQNVIFDYSFQPWHRRCIQDSMTVMTKTDYEPKETLNYKFTTIYGMQEVKTVPPALVLHHIAHTCPIIGFPISFTAEQLSTTLIPVSLHPYLKLYNIIIIILYNLHLYLHNSQFWSIPPMLFAD